MDFHFYSSKISSNSAINIKKSLLYFVPVFVLSAILPVLIGLAQRPVETDFSASASKNELSLWFTPSSVEVSRGTPVKFTLTALYDSESKLLSGLEIPLVAEGLTLKESKVTYKIPFRGEVDIYEVTVIPRAAGKFTLSIDKQKVIDSLQALVSNVNVSNAILDVR